MSRLLQKFRQDVVGIALLGAGLFIGLSLLSFNPLDPSFNSIGQSLKVSNYCGIVGSFLSDALYQLFGMSAWVISAAFLYGGAGSLSGKPIRLKDLRLVWAGLMTISLSGLLSLYFPVVKVFQNQIHIGGLIGMGISQVLVKAFNPIGVQIILWSVFGVLLVFTSERTLKDLFRTPINWVRDFPWSKSFSILSGFFKGWMQEERPTLKIKKEVKIEHESRINQFYALKDVVEPSEKPGEPEQLAKIPISLVTKGKELFESAIESVTATTETTTADVLEKKRKVVLKTRIERRIENWELPKISMLEDPPASRVRIDEKELRKKAEILKEKLKTFGAVGEVVGIRPGPVVTMFEFKPNTDVKVSSITALEDDLTLALSSESLRILAPIPGRDVVGVETSNAVRETVYFKDLVADDMFWSEDFKLPIALGKQSNGESKIVDLRKMPHLMVAGTTGSGKSVFIVSALTGLLFKHSPKTLKLVLIDPKQVDLVAFDKIPHLVCPPVREPKQAASILRWAVKEMEKRNDSFSRFNCRNVEDFNTKVSALTKEELEQNEAANSDLENTHGKKSKKYYFTPQPYIVIVVEELGDLMSIDKANVEQSIQRLAQMARAAGIHLILAMQSPRKEVVTGLIKANIPGRISFKVTSGMDSRIILDETGAERLIGQGDMLFKNPGGSGLIRHHGPFLKDKEIHEVVKHWTSQAEPEYNEALMKLIEGGEESGGNSDGNFEDSNDMENDSKYSEILDWVSTQKTISTTQIQTYFSVGYPKAAKMMMTFEQRGIVGPQNGSKPRQVLVNNLREL